MTKPSRRFGRATALIDEANREDPNTDLHGEKEHPRELLYAQRLTEWVHKLTAQPSEALLLAARAQHIRRWTRPRSDYEKGLVGYLTWREELKTFHADTAAELLAEAGYTEEELQKVRSLILKEHWPDDAEACVLEDALCLMFLQYQFLDVIEKTEEEKMVGIVQKTWEKMTPSAQQHALALDMSSREKALMAKAGLV